MRFWKMPDFLDKSSKFAASRKCTGSGVPCDPCRKTRYSANAGLKELRVAIAEKSAKYYGMQFDPLSEIIVTLCGNMI